MSENKIEGGYIILARRIIESEIWQKPPAYLKIWIYILLQVNFKNTKTHPRGTGLFNFRQEKIPGITLNQVYEFLRWAKTLNPRDFTTQITTQKTTRGVVLKINNYNKYQDIENYCYQHRNQHKKQHTPNTITGIKENNIDISNNIYNNLSSSTQKNENKISDDEREILKNYVKRKKLAKTNLRGYVKKIIDNGDYIDILKEEKERQAKLELQRQQAEENIPPPETEDIEETENARAKARAMVLQGLKGKRK